MLIEQTLFTKAAAASRCVCHADLWGEREQKYRWLWEHGSADTAWVQLEPVVRHVIIFGHGHGLQRAIIDESQHRTPERLIIAQH